MILKNRKPISYLLSLFLLAGCMGGMPAVYAEETGVQNNLLNGSFEKGQTWTGNYKTQDQSAVPSWNTTATDKQIELFRANTGIYISGVRLEPSEGSYAAELNANEESTLYQIIDTPEASIYQWGLDHGARNGTDRMALIIGPNQTNAPAKPSKDGRDQFMQMVDWLETQDSIPDISGAAIETEITLFSKKFGTNGSFLDNSGENPFSFTQSRIYTEEWHIWIITSQSVSSGTNPWHKCGTNVEGNTSLSGDAYYNYTVPVGQDKTIFGFVSVGYVDSPTSADKAKTYGNFLDNINFTLYHPLTASTTAHGSITASSNGDVNGDRVNKVESGQRYQTYIADASSVTVQAIVKKEDADKGCLFVGMYRSGVSGEETYISTQQGGWEEFKDPVSGDTTYTYRLNGLKAGTILKFVFVKYPTVTYDPNGGKPYVVDRTYNTDEENNVYSFRPVDVSGSGLTYIPPLVSHEAEGPAGKEADWKFTGWKLTGDDPSPNTYNEEVITGSGLGTMTLPAVHAVACDFRNSENAQYFKFYKVDNAGNLTSAAAVNTTGAAWTVSEGGVAKEPVYANVHRGFTMVAQWRWKQRFVPQKKDGSSYTTDASFGTVSISDSAIETSDNYRISSEGSISYFAEENENITVSATPAEGCVFEGWYSETGKLISTNPVYSYNVTAENVRTCYARFASAITQTFKCQVSENGTDWNDLPVNSTIGALDRYTYADAAGAPVSCTAMAGNGYKFAGWFEESGIPVTSGSGITISQDGATISYNCTANKTYIARFMPCVEITVQGEVKEVMYDGNPHTVGYTTSYAIRGASSSTLPEGMTFQLKSGSSAKSSVTKTNAGTYNLSLSENDFEVTNSSSIYLYTLKVTPGRLTIKAKDRAITVTDCSVVYDGAAHGITVDGIVAGDSVTYGTDGVNYTSSEPVQSIKPTSQAVYVQVKNSNYNPSTVTASALLTVKQRPLYINVASQSKDYDGTPLTSSAFTYTSGSSLAWGDAITLSIEGSQTNAGTSSNAAISYSIKNSLGDDVTDCYDIHIQDGTLTVNPIPDTITVNGSLLDKVYDGTPVSPAAIASESALFTRNGSGDISYKFYASDSSGAADLSNAVEAPSGAGIWYIQVCETASGNYLASESTVSAFRITEPSRPSGGGHSGGSSGSTGNKTEPEKPENNGGSTDSQEPQASVDPETGIVTSADGEVLFVPTGKVQRPEELDNRVSMVLRGYATPQETGISQVLNTVDHIQYVQGYTDGTVQPEGNVTRAEVCMMFYRLLLKPDVELTRSFSDIPEDRWYAKAVETLAGMGILNGYQDGTFAPDRAITRDEFTAIAMRFAKNTAGNSRFNDVTEDDWARALIGAAADYGWINGYEDNSFRPKNNIRRSETMSIINHMLYRAADEDYMESNDEVINRFTDLKDRTAWYFGEVIEATGFHDYELVDYFESWDRAENRHNLEGDRP